MTSLPSRRINPNATPDGKTDLLARLLRKGDPLADAVDEECQARGPKARKALDAGLRHGLATLHDAPPAIAALLREVETVPEWVSPETLKRGGALLSVHPLWSEIAHLNGMLHTYISPAIARVLVGTGRLAHMAAQRAQETGIWQLSATLPGGLTRGAPGYVATLQVRLLHARVRRRLREGWDTEAWGVPVNQVDLARTWLSSVFVPLRALTSFGFDFSSTEIQEIYRIWEYINFLMGLDPDLYRGVSDQAQAEEVLRLIDTTNEPLDDNSRTVSTALLGVAHGMLMHELDTPPALTAEMLYALTRFIHGNDVSDALGIPQSELTHLIPLVVHDNQNTHRLQRLVPGAWEEMIARNDAATRAVIAASGSAEYHAYADHKNT